jgi:predicted lysophospholipase L1 biosynthesis ABC-type transport system permease subunit
MNSATVAIASHRAAQLFWPRTNALGQIFERHGRSFEIVGIVGDVRGSDTQGQRGGGLDREPRAAIYFAAAQSPQRTMTLLVSAGAAQRDVEASLRRALRELDPSLPLRQVRPLHEWIEESIAPTRFATTLAIAFAVCALLLASVGVYGVLAYTVAARTKEIGVRVAIGASRPRVIGLVLREGMMWTGSGILVGMLAAFAVASLLGAVLFETPAHDPVTFAGVGVTMAIVALLACAIPALRAVRIDPTVAMRTE